MKKVSQMASENEELLSKFAEMGSEMITDYNKKSFEEQMKVLQRMSIHDRKEGNIQGAKKIQHSIKEERKLEREAHEEINKRINEAWFKRSMGIPEEHRTDDGDQSPVFGYSAVNKMKKIWVSGLDWNPNNPCNSPWLLVLASGDFDEMTKIIDKTPNNEIKDLIEKRETLYNLSAIFHIVRGANMLEKHQNKFEVSHQFCDHSKTPRHIDCLRKIIELGGNVNARDFAGFTPLHHCVTSHGNAVKLELAKILLENGADVNAKNRLGETALIQPMMGKELGLIRLLLDYGVDPSIKDNLGVAALNMNAFDIDCNILFAEARKKKAKITREEAKKDEGGVLSCEACEKPSTKRCTGCYVTRYCSKECQVSHWKNHKKACRENKDLFVPVRLETIPVATSISWVQGGKTSTISSVNKQSKTKSVFAVKIQLPRSSDKYHKLLVYDKNKEVHGLINENEPSYFPIREIVEKNGVYGLKGYFDAIFDKSDLLKINVKNLKLPRDW